MARNRLLPLILWSALMALGLALIASRLTITTDLQQFMPRDADSREGRLLGELQQSAATRLILIGLEGAGEAELARLSDALAERLRGTGRFLRVSNSNTLPPAEEQQLWFDHRYLLVDQQWDAVALHQALQARLRELASPLALLTKQQLASDPTAALRTLQRGWQAGQGPQSRHGVWFSADGSLALLLAETVSGGMAIEAQQQNVAQIRSAFTALADKGTARLLLSGPAVIAVASSEQIRTEATTLSIAASIAVMAILLLVYRSLPLWLLSTLPLIAAMVTAIAVTLLLFGTLHGITLAFGITLLGVAIDYPIHLFSHLRPHTEVRTTLRTIWPTLRLGVLSTALGYLAMISNRFEGLAQLGLFAGSGLLAAAATTRWLLPALLPATWTGRSHGLQLPQPGGWMRPLVWLLPLLAAAYLLGSGKPLWEGDIAALSPVSSDARALDARLRGALQAPEPGHMLLVEGDSAEQVLQRSEVLLPALEGLRREGAMGSFSLAAQLVPSVQRQLARRATLPDGATLREQLAAAQQGLPFREGAFAEFVDAVSASRDLAPLTPAGLGNSVLATRLEAQLFARDDHWYGLINLSGVHDAAAIARWRQGQAMPWLGYIDLRATTNTLLEEFRLQALTRLGWGALLIGLMLIWGLRRTSAVASVLLPVAAAMVVSLALLHLLGERLSLFHLMALLLVLGIGIDYSLFFSRGERDEGERAGTAHALSVCAISTVSVFAILALSRLPVLHAIGLTVFIGVACSYLFAWSMGAVIGNRSDERAE